MCVYAWLRLEIKHRQPISRGGANRNMQTHIMFKHLHQFQTLSLGTNVLHRHRSITNFDNKEAACRSKVLQATNTDRDHKERNRKRINSFSDHVGSAFPG